MGAQLRHLQHGSSWLSALPTVSFEILNQWISKRELEINWNTNAENYNSYEYSKTIDKIKIAVNAIQVD